MATHRATCQDCHETYTDSDLLKVSEWAEDHKRTEVHDVRIERAVATDGGQPVRDTVYVAAQSDGGATGIYHTDRDCRALCSARSVRDYPLASLVHTRELCRICAGDVSFSTVTDKSAVMALRDADPEPVPDGGHIPGHQPATAPPVERGRDWVCPGCDQAYHGRPNVVDDGIDRQGGDS